MTQTRVAIALGIAALAAAALSVSAQTSADALTVRQVEFKYPNMSPIHILKCDYNHDDLIEPNELPCVQGIYQALYKGRD